MIHVNALSNLAGELGDGCLAGDGTVVVILNRIERCAVVVGATGDVVVHSIPNFTVGFHEEALALFPSFVFIPPTVPTFGVFGVHRACLKASEHGGR
jgi:hypothetical protein